MIRIIKNVHFTSVQSWTEPFAQRISMVDIGSGVLCSWARQFTSQCLSSHMTTNGY